MSWPSYFVGLFTIPHLAILGRWLFAIAELISDTTVDLNNMWKPEAEGRHFKVSPRMIAVSFDGKRVYAVFWPWYWRGSYHWTLWLTLLVGLPIALGSLALCVPAWLS